MYSDPIQTYEFASLDGTPVEVEATADILALKGRIADVGTGTDNVLDGVLLPNGGTVEFFELIITEALTNGHATNHVVKVQQLDADGSTTSTLVTLTLPADATEITTADVRATDTTTPTAAQAVAVGARIVAGRTNAGTASPVPKSVPPGARVYVECTTAAGAAGGAYYAVVGIRHGGGPSADAAADSPITSLAG